MPLSLTFLPDQVTSIPGIIEHFTTIFLNKRMAEKIIFLAQNGQFCRDCIEYDRRLHICLNKIEVKGIIFRNA